VGIFEYLLGSSDRDPNEGRPSPAGVGPDIDSGRTKTQTEKDLRKVQSQYDPENDDFGSDANDPKRAGK
jgi:hypothetical protein